MGKVTKPIDGPHRKGENRYLTNPVWVGNAVPDRYMGHPWGLGGECWWARAYVLAPGSEFGWTFRRVFAGMDPDAVLAAAQAWLDAGAATRPTPLETLAGAAAPVPAQP